MKRRAPLVLLSLLIVISLLAGCGGAPAPATPTSAPAPTAAEAATAVPANTPAVSTGPKILRIRVRADIQNLDPAYRISGVDEEVSLALFSNLVQFAPNSYDIVNDLAESIKQSDDGLTVSFKLKEGVMWPKGYGEVTADDVKYSFERIANPENKSPYADDWAVLDHVEVTGKYTGKIILKKPFAPLWRSTLPGTSGFIVCKKYVEEVGPEKFATNPLGTGPYVLAEWKPKEEIILKRNQEYFGQRPVWDEIHLIPIEDAKTAEVALEAGDVSFSEIDPTSVDRFENNPDYVLFSRPTLTYSWIGMNVENPKLKDINVRQAIRYAIDVPSIIKATYMDRAEQAYGLIAPGLTGYWKDAPHYQRDVAKAKEYMAKAGLQTLDLRMDIQDTVEYRTWAEIAQQNLKEIGINLQVNPMDSASFWSIGEGDKGKDVELFSMMYTMQPDPSWATMWFTCNQIGVWNWMRWCNSEFDDLHMKGLATTDEAEREAIYIQMQKLWDEAVHSIWITHGTLWLAHTHDIKPATTPHGVLQIEYFEPAS